jgi:hypothetical protein
MKRMQNGGNIGRKEFPEFVLKDKNVFLGGVECYESMWR